MESVLAQARSACVASCERKEKEAQKSVAIQSVLDWSPGGSGRVVTKYSQDRDRGELLPLLDACLAAGVPPTNVQIRAALFDVAPLLLEGAAKYRKFLDAVLTERRRKGLENADQEAPPAGEEETEPTDTDMEQYLQYVALFAAGMKVVILGGVPRGYVCEELKGLLQCDEVLWLESKKSDKSSKFQTEIKKADLLVAVKNFASHEIVEKAREWKRADGGHFIALPGGYGVKQIVHQLYHYLLRNEGAHRTFPK